MIWKLFMQIIYKRVDKFTDLQEKYQSAIKDYEQKTFKRSFASLYQTDNEIQFIIAIDLKSLELAGHCSYKNNNGVADIYLIGVKKEFQNLKIGTNILKQIPISKIIIEVSENNLAAILFYKKYGFEYVYSRKNYYKSNTNALVYLYEENNEV